MAFEGKVVLWISSVHVLDGNSTFHTAQGESGGGGFLVLEDGDTAVLVLQRRLHLLELLGLAVQLVDDDAPAGASLLR